MNDRDMWMDPDLSKFENHLMELSLSGENHRLPFRAKDGTPGELDFNGHIVARSRDGDCLCVTYDSLILVYHAGSLSYSHVGPDEGDVVDALRSLGLEEEEFLRAMSLLGLDAGEYDAMAELLRSVGCRLPE
jgi:hypothetical protein